jgi:tRNA uracil 4-sulfurtransferase
MNYSHILVHYAEIGLKGKNRKLFEEKLVDNMRLALFGCDVKVRRLYGRILIELNDQNIKEISDKLVKVFGISSFSPVVTTKPELDLIKQAAVDLVGQTEKEWQTFKAITKRANKNFETNSMEVSMQIGEVVLNAVPDKKVDVHKPDLEIRVEITDKHAFIFTEKIQGPGGLPVGSSGKVVSLLSGGIDSPVASWQLMKRGCEVIFVHFHSAPQTTQAAIDKVQELADELAQWQPNTKTHMIPFLDIQNEIVKETKGEYRVVLYRRFMFKIADQIAKKENAKALVTGESVGQVASQTLDNIAAINDAVTIPILRPLIGMDKIEIIERAKQINTYELSILPHDDCCTLFVPRHPATRANIGITRQEEGKLDSEKLINDAL